MIQNHCIICYRLFTSFEQMNPRFLDVSQTVRHVIVYNGFSIFTYRCNNKYIHNNTR